MNLKLGLCVLYLNLLVLLVAYETEARKMVEGNLQGKRLNFPVSVKQAEKNHQQAKEEYAQVHLSSYGDLQNKDKTQNFKIYHNQEDNNYHQAKEEYAQVHLSSYGDLQNKDKTQNFKIYHNQEDNNYQQAKEEYAQVHLSSYGDLQNKDKTQNFKIYHHQEDNNYQQAKEEYAQVHLSSYGDLQNKDKTQNFKIYHNQEDNNYQQAKEEYAQVHLSSYGDLQNKDDTQNFRIYNNHGDDNHQQEKKEYAQVHLSSYGDLQNKDDTQKFWINENEWESNHQQAKEENAHIHSSSHMNHIDPSLRVFFLMDDLKLRKEITISFPRRDLSSSPSFLPKEEAELIPFSLKELPNLLQHFSFSRNSLQVKGMEDTLRVCEAPPIKGETKYCATSTEAMLDFVQEIMGEKIQIEALSTTHFSNSTPLLQKYTILEAPQEVEAPKMVACHTMPYVYAVFYCHCTISKSKVFKVSLGDENGDRVDAIAVCHLDTSEWSPSHVSFQVLGILPGTTPICHFFSSDNIVWVPKIAIAQVI